MEKMKKVGMLLYSVDEKGRRYLSSTDEHLSNVIKNKSTEYYKKKLAKRNNNK